MAKILLVEDDNNLREIYEARFQAEGYQIVSAHDGEEALVVAKAEKPDLVISDVMMPKISGFEMLDILRNTDTLKNVKVIMLTALGQNDDQQRADKLGADKYLVKSQVTLEDIVNVANELLQSGASQPDAAPSNSPATSTPPPTEPTVNPAVASPAPEPSSGASPVDPAVTALNASDPDGQSTPSEPVAPTAAAPDNVAAATPTTVTPDPTSVTPPPSQPVDLDLAEPAKKEEEAVGSQIESFMNSPDSTAEPVTVSAPQSPSQSTSPSVELPDKPMASEENKTEDKPAEYSPQPMGKKVIEPLPSTDSKPDINDLLAKEKSMETASETPTPGPTITPTASSTPMTEPPSTSAPPADPTASAVDPDNVAL